MVRIFFDTSVLVAAILSQHPQHAPCLRWLRQAKESQIQGYISAHTMAELFATLSNFPMRPRLSPAIATRLIEGNLAEFEVVPLDREDYLAVMHRLVRLGFSGGAIYDATIAQAALKVQANCLLTLNVKHFVRLGEDIAGLIQMPSDE